MVEAEVSLGDLGSMGSRSWRENNWAEGSVWVNFWRW